MFFYLQDVYLQVIMDVYLQVIAFTCTHGCVSVRQAVANIARTQRANGVKKMVPIYKGASASLIQ